MISNYYFYFNTHYPTQKLSYGTHYCGGFLGSNCGIFGIFIFSWDF